jgi:hypothetical protein
MFNKNKAKQNEDPSNARKRRRSIIQNRIPDIVSNKKDSKTSKPGNNASPSSSGLQSPLYARTPLTDIQNTNGMTTSTASFLSPVNSPLSNGSQSHKFYQSPSYTVIPQPLKPFNPFDLHPTCLNSNNLPQSPFMTPNTTKPLDFTYFTQHPKPTYQSLFVTQCTQPSTSHIPNQIRKTARSVQHLGVNLMEKFAPSDIPIHVTPTTQSDSGDTQLPEKINDLCDEEQSKASTESESDDSDSDNSSDTDDEWEIADDNDPIPNNNKSTFTGVISTRITLSDGKFCYRKHLLLLKSNSQFKIHMQRLLTWEIQYINANIVMQACGIKKESPRQDIQSILTSRFAVVMEKSKYHFLNNHLHYSRNFYLRMTQQKARTTKIIFECITLCFPLHHLA